MTLTWLEDIPQGAESQCNPDSTSVNRGIKSHTHQNATVLTQKYEYWWVSLVHANSMSFSPNLSQLLPHSQYQTYKETNLWVRYVPFRRATEPIWNYFLFKCVLLMIIRSRMTSSLLQHRMEKQDPLNPFNIIKRARLQHRYPMWRTSSTIASLMAAQAW